MFPRTKWKDVIDAPPTLPNPYALVINGQLYDGSAKVELTIESGEGTTYAAGAGLKLTDTVFSVNNGTGLKISSNQLVVDETVVQHKLTAGTGVKISNNTISLDSTVTQPRLVNGTGTTISSDHTTVNIDFTTVQKKLVAGSNITITDNVISATVSGGDGKTYVAGKGIAIAGTDNKISAAIGNGLWFDGSNNIAVDTTFIQPKLKAGTNVTIDESTNTISFSGSGTSGTTYTAGDGLILTDTEFSANIGSGLKFDTDGAITIDGIDASAADSVDASVVDSIEVDTLLSLGTGLMIDSDNALTVDASVFQKCLTNGTGTTISGTSVNVDFTTVQQKLNAGTNITIDEATNTISASGGTSIDLVQSTGSSTTAAMSQNAVSTELTRLEQLIEDYHYVPISVSSLSTSPSSAERGNTITSITFNWTTSGAAATAATLAGQDVLGKTSLTYSTSIAAATTYTLSVTDARAHTATRSVTIPFYWRVHWGTSSSTSELDSSFVLGLSNSALSSTRTRTINVVAATGEYIYYAIPTSYGTPTFNVGGFDGGFSVVASFTHTNQYNQTVPFTIYRSDNSGLGTQTVKIS